MVRIHHTAFVLTSCVRLMLNSLCDGQKAQLWCVTSQTFLPHACRETPGQMSCELFSTVAFSSPLRHKAENVKQLGSRCCVNSISHLLHGALELLQCPSGVLFSNRFAVCGQLASGRLSYSCILLLMNLGRGFCDFKCCHVWRVGPLQKTFHLFLSVFILLTCLLLFTHLSSAQCDW